MTAYDRAGIVASFAQTRKTLRAARDFGAAVAPEIDRIHFVACGSPNRAMASLAWHLERLSPRLEVKRWFPAEYMAQNPARLDRRTLVVLASKSGTTAETVAAARWLADKPVRRVAFSQFADRPLAQTVSPHFLVGETPESFIAMAMLIYAMGAGLLEHDGWPHADRLLASLDALPEAIVEAAVANDARAAADARAFARDEIFYHVASGPCSTTAYVFGVCVLMEMLWLHSTPIEAAEFFHGPFEIVDKQTPLFLMLGEDASRPLMERVARFCDSYAGRVMRYDSRDYPMTGVDPEMRGMLAPFVLQSALKRFAAHLSELRGQPLTTRRYMWKVDY